MYFLRLRKGEESLCVPKGKFRLSNSWRGGIGMLWRGEGSECCRSPGPSVGALAESKEGNGITNKAVNGQLNSTCKFPFALLATMY